MSNEEWEKEVDRRVFENRRPIKVIIQEAFDPWFYRLNNAQIGSFTRKAKGQTYNNPRILLKHYFKKHIGKSCYIVEGKASIEGNPRAQNKDVLILFLE
jgi:hypothetical protein